jgi:cyclic pyranopterin phosphate synthase
MPHNDKNFEWISHDEILRFEEFIRIIRVAASLGIKKIKITGGEPLARRGIVPFIGDCAKIDGIEKISLTTNALLLEDKLDGLLEAGLRGINISLDSLNEATYKHICSFDGIKIVKQNIEAILKTNLNIKINCVPIEGLNEADLAPLARLAEKNNIAVRFIELMPLGFASNYKAVSEEKIIAMLEKEFGKLELCEDKIGEGPARYFTAKSFAGKIGFISSLSHKFCASCNRLRLTSVGMLKPCLSSNISVNLKEILRSGSGGDDEIAEAIKKTILLKPASHSFIVEGTSNEINSAEHKTKNMSKIGG